MLVLCEVNFKDDRFGEGGVDLNAEEDRCDFFRDGCAVPGEDGGLVSPGWGSRSLALVVVAEGENVWMPSWRLPWPVVLGALVEVVGGLRALGRRSLRVCRGGKLAGLRRTSLSNSATF